MAPRAVDFNKIIAKRIRGRNDNKRIELQLQEPGLPFTTWLVAADMPAELIAAFDANSRNSRLLDLSLELRSMVLHERAVNLNYKHTHISAVSFGNGRFRTHDVFSFEEILSRREQLSVCLSNHAHLAAYLGSLPYRLISKASDARPGVLKSGISHGESVRSFDGGDMAHKNVMYTCRKIYNEMQDQVIPPGLHIYSFETPALFLQYLNNLHVWPAMSPSRRPVRRSMGHLNAIYVISPPAEYSHMMGRTVPWPTTMFPQLKVVFIPEKKANKCNTSHDIPYSKVLAQAWALYTERALLLDE